MRCDQCSFWDVDQGKRECQGKIVGECQRAMPWWEASRWDDSLDGDIDRVLKPEFSDRRFFAQDGSDYRAFVLTTADFFCAEFKRKE